MGEIQITGMATVVPSNSTPPNQEAAEEDSDFTTAPVSTIIPAGATTGVITLPLLDNEESSPLKVFEFTLVDVQRVPFTQGKTQIHIMLSYVYMVLALTQAL